MSGLEDIGGDFVPPKHKQEDSELDITPMIDITFLLLAFFVVASKMDPTTAVDMPKASYGSAISEKESVVLIVTQGADKDQFEVFKGRSKEENSQIRETEPTALEEAIQQYVETELSSHPDFQSILIKGEGRVKTGAIEIVKRGISLSELAQTRQIYVGVEDEQ